MKLTAQNIVKQFQTATGSLQVLRGVSLELRSGHWMTLRGASGAGKTTLLHILSTLETPTKGRVLIDDQDIATWSPGRLAHFRRRGLGVVYQSAELIPRFSVWQNVTVGLIPEGVPTRERRDISQRILDRLGMGDKANEYPMHLSGGERQRVAIARAVAHRPNLVLADEPTNQVDPNTKAIILDLFRELREQGVGLIVASHETELSAIADSCVELVDGSLTLVS